MKVIVLLLLELISELTKGFSSEMDEKVDLGTLKLVDSPEKAVKPPKDASGFEFVFTGYDWLLKLKDERLAGFCDSIVLDLADENALTPDVKFKELRGGLSIEVDSTGGTCPTNDDNAFNGLPAIMFTLINLLGLSGGVMSSYLGTGIGFKLVDGAIGDDTAWGFVPSSDLIFKTNFSEVSVLLEELYFENKLELFVVVESRLNWSTWEPLDDGKELELSSPETS